MKAVLIHASTPMLYIGAYGNEAVQTPALDRLAAEGVVFDAHETDGGAPEHFLETLLTGRHAFAARVEDAPGLLSQLKRSGVATAILSTRASESTGDWTVAVSLPGEKLMTPICEAIAQVLDQLEQFDDWLFVLDLGSLEQDQQAEAAGDDANVIPETELGDDGDSIAEATTDVEADEGEFEDLEDEESALDDDDMAEMPDLAGALADEEMNSPELQSLLAGQGTTAAEVEDFDAFAGWFREELEERGLWPELALVFTGQGDSADPDGLCSVGPEHPLRPSVSRLPLIISLPDCAPFGRRIAALTQPADLNATISSLFGHSPGVIHGQSLIPLCAGQLHWLREYSCAAVVNGATKAAVLTTTAWKFLSLTTSAGESHRWLFRQPEDRFGMLNLHHQLHEYTDRLESCLRDYLSAAQQPGPLEAPELPPERVEIQTTIEGESP